MKTNAKRCPAGRPRIAAGLGLAMPRRSTPSPLRQVLRLSCPWARQPRCLCGAL